MRGGRRGGGAAVVGGMVSGSHLGRGPGRWWSADGVVGTAPVLVGVRGVVLVGCVVGVRRPPAGWWGAFVRWCSAVSYSPTPWRGQYHRRWQA